MPSNCRYLVQLVMDANGLIIKFLISSPPALLGPYSEMHCDLYLIRASVAATHFCSLHHRHPLKSTLLKKA